MIKMVLKTGHKHYLRDPWFLNPKTVLHLYPDPAAQHNGIRLLNALDWLLGKEEP